jgi:hypothetical protein
MKKQPWIILVIVLLYCCACGTGNGNALREPTVTPSPVFSTPTQTAAPSQTPSPTPGKLITATVWSKDPDVPILLYHQFAADIAPASTSLKVRFSDFRQELEDLYASGYSLVSFEKWVAGGLEIPPGRHPLIFSMDDLFFNNQITLLDDGTPSPETGIGMLWQFYQEHPDFGFHAILFATLGDKLYANPDKPDWQDKLARTIVWCIDHDVLVYNHTYLHVRLDKSDVNGIKHELLNNDTYLRELLLRAGRPDLIPRLNNFFALPYSIWPTTKAGVDALENYTNPEGKLMLGIFEAGFDTTKLLPPPYSANFDRWHIPRFTATLSSVHMLVQQSSQMPTTTTCGLDSGSGNSAFLGNQINLAIQNNKCPAGIYVTDQFIFDATKPPDVKLVFTRTDYLAP